MATKSRPNHAGRKIDPKERIKLWVRAGGMCEFPGCDEYLLEDEMTGHEVTMEEIAHLAAQSTAGPRGLSSVPMNKRNLADNLMLLCTEHHHKLYDREPLQAEYTEERVREDKRLHEDRIRTQTALGPDYATLAIRMFGKVRGSQAAISREEIRKAVFCEDRRYPQFLGTTYTVDIDLSGLPAETSSEYWQTGRTLIDEQFDTLVIPAMKRHGLKHRSVFAFARIPFLVHLGVRLADKCATTLYQRHRDQANEWTWPSKAGTIMFRGAKVREGRDAGKVAIALSVTGRIPLSAIDKCFTVYEISPFGADCGTSVLRSAMDVESFAGEYRKALRQIEANHPTASSISLYPAVPIPIAVTCGMAILPDVTPPLRLHEKTAGGYEFVLEVRQKGGV